jgi:hypothetical protein
MRRGGNKHNRKCGILHAIDKKMVYRVLSVDSSMWCRSTPFALSLSKGSETQVVLVVNAKDANE